MTEVPIYYPDFMSVPSAHRDCKQRLVLFGRTILGGNAVSCERGIKIPIPPEGATGEVRELEWFRKRKVETVECGRRHLVALLRGTSAAQTTVKGVPMTFQG